MANDLKQLNEAYRATQTSSGIRPRSFTTDTPDKEGFYRGVETTWPGDGFFPHVQMHYDAFRSPQFIIKTNGRKVFTSDNPSEAKGFLRKEFNIRWDDSGHMRRMPIDRDLAHRTGLMR